MQIWLRGFRCLRCGHEWKPRKKGTPLKCPACDSPNWQEARPGEGVPGGNEAEGVDATPHRVRGTPARELAEGLRGLTWPDDKFADDLEAIQAAQPVVEEPSWPN